MKLLAENISNSKESSVTVQAQDKEDLWILYNLIQKDDRITVTTTRNYQKEGSSKVERVLVKLQLRVANIEYEAESSTLRCKGRTVSEHKYVPMGSYHTAVIDTKYAFTLYKDEFDSYSLDIIHEATSITERAEIGAVVLHEGVAHFCLITDTMRILVAKVEKSIPKKRRGGGDTSGYDKAMEKFFSNCYETFKRKFDLLKLKVILLASPGTVAQTLLEHIMAKAATEDEKLIMQSKSKFVIAHSFNGYLQALDETLKTPAVIQQLKDTKYVKDAQLLDRFFTELNKDNGVAWYGKEECTKAIGIEGAVSHLLVTDSLFRSDDVKERKSYIALGDKVKEQGGEVSIFSSLHDSGEQLDKITGIAVILNYPLPDLDESDDEEDDE